MKSRESGIDLLRCLGLLFVNGVHAFLYNGFYSEFQNNAMIWAADCFRWLFFGCNGLFMMITGYLKSTKTPNKKYYRSLVPILVGYFLTCVITFPIRHFLLDEKLTLMEWLDKLINFANYGWYVEMYIGLFLIAPFLNLAMNALKTDKQLYLMAGTFVVLTALPSITPLSVIPDYWTSLYPITYYIIGAVIRRLQPQIKPRYTLSATALLAMLLGLFTILTTNKGFSSGFGQGYGGFWITAMVTTLFLALYRLRIPQIPARILAWAAGGVFEGYICSRLFDVWVYDCFPRWHTPEKYILLFLCVTVPIFIVSILAGKLIHGIAEYICRTKKPQVEKLTTK